MAIQWLDFLNAPRAKSGVADLLPSILQGYQMAKEPQKMAQEQRQRELANILSQHKANYYPKIQEQNLEKGRLGIKESELNLGALPTKLQQEQEKRRIENETGQYNLDTAPERFALERDKVAAAIAKANRPVDSSIAERRWQKIRANTWDGMPPNVQQNTVAVLNGLGVRPDKAVERLVNGETVEEIGASLGYTPDQIDRVIKKNVATNRNVSQENQRNANVAELNVLEERVSDAMAPYVQTFAGMSPKAVMDQFKGGNDDELAKYLAARSLQSELAALRLKVMSANVGQGALHEMVTGAFGNSKVLPAGIKPEVYKKMNHYVGQWLNEASTAANNEMFGQPTTPRFSGGANPPPAQDEWEVVR